jgi:hypothetical protein
MTRLQKIDKTLVIHTPSFNGFYSLFSEATPCGEPGGDLASVLEDVARWRENRLRELVLGETASAGGDVGSTATSLSIGCKLYGTNVMPIRMQAEPA